jgi:Protein of unknown function (DUF3467)
VLQITHRIVRSCASACGGKLSATASISVPAAAPAFRTLAGTARFKSVLSGAALSGAAISVGTFLRLRVITCLIPLSQIEFQVTTGKVMGARRLVSDVCQYEGSMTTPNPPVIRLDRAQDYRENYANSVQIRVNLWDFFLMFGTIVQSSPDNVAIQNFQGVYVSPPQAKALLNVLQQNVHQYEAAFGEIRLEPNVVAAGGSIVQ